MDIGSAFSFVFDDEDWLKKVLIGAVLALTGIGFIPIIGYGLEITRRVAQGHPQPLPDWDDWGKKIIEGLLNGIITFIWALPIVLMSACISIGSTVAANNIDSDAGGIVMVVLSICVGLVMLIYGIALALFLPAAMAKYAVSGEFGAAFRVGEIVGMVRNNLGTYLMVLLIYIVAQIISSLGSIALGCGVFFTSFYAVLITYHAYGQAYRVAAGDVAGSEPDVYAY